MYQARLRHGVPIQIMIPDGLERSRSGAIYLTTAEPTTITDDEAAHIQAQMDNPKTGLGKMPIVMDKMPGKVQQVVQQEQVVETTSEPEPEPEHETEDKAAGVDEQESQPQGGKTKRRKR